MTATGTGNVIEDSNEITGLVVSKGVFRVGEEISGTGLKRGTRITAVGEHSLMLEPAAAESVSGDVLTGSPAGVVGVLGGSADGSRVYFVAGGVLAADTREYEYVNAKGEHEKASETAASEPEVANLYESYQPPSGPAVVTFIARLDDPGVGWKAMAMKKTGRTTSAAVSRMWRGFAGDGGWGDGVVRVAAAVDGV